MRVVAHAAILWVWCFLCRRPELGLHICPHQTQSAPSPGLSDAAGSSVCPVRLGCCSTMGEVPASLCWPTRPLCWVDAVLIFWALSLLFIELLICPVLLSLISPLPCSVPWCPLGIVGDVATDLRVTTSLLPDWTTTGSVSGVEKPDSDVWVGTSLLGCPHYMSASSAPSSFCGDVGIGRWLLGLSASIEVSDRSWPGLLRSTVVGCVGAWDSLLWLGGIPGLTASPGDCPRTGRVCPGFALTLAASAYSRLLDVLPPLPAFPINPLISNISFFNCNICSACAFSTLNT